MVAAFYFGALVIVSAVVAIQWSVFGVQLFAFLLRRPSKALSDPNSDVDPSLKIAVLVPAHNEAEVIGPIIAGILEHAPDNARLLVVADNCDDDTATLASDAGAEVIVRDDRSEVGKSYALQFGIEYLSTEPPDVLISVDADCRVGASTIAALANACASLNRPIQAKYLLEAPPSPNPGYRVAEFALRVKNWFRPAGFHALGLPCQLTGAGMAFPWSVLKNVKVASGSIVEDLALGLDLAAMGSAPVFLESAHVESTFPGSDGAAFRQRTRWEHGHLRTIFSYGPRYFARALRSGNGQLFAMVADLLVPPIALFAVMTLLLGALTGFHGFQGGSWIPAALVCIPAFISATLLGAAWIGYARDILPWSKVWLVPVYIVKKLPLYLLALIRPERGWVKTDRDAQ